MVFKNPTLFLKKFSTIRIPFCERNYCTIYSKAPGEKQKNKFGRRRCPISFILDNTLSITEQLTELLMGVNHTSN